MIAVNIRSTTIRFVKLIFYGKQRQPSITMIDFFPQIRHFVLSIGLRGCSDSKCALSQSICLKTKNDSEIPCL